MKKTLFYILLFLFLITLINNARAQCGKELAEQAKKQVNKNETIIKSYFVGFSQSWNYQNSAKFPIILNAGTKYRFIIKNSPDYRGRAIVRLRFVCAMNMISNFEKGGITQSNRFVKNGFGFADYYETFEYFTTDKNGVYEIQVRFTDGNEGCAAILVVYEKK